MKISPERRILLLITGMIAGIGLYLTDYALLVIGGAGIIWVIASILDVVARRYRTLGPGLSNLIIAMQRLAVGGLIGGLAMALQLSQMPEMQLSSGLSGGFTGQVIRIDGTMSERVRYWIRLDSSAKSSFPVLSGLAGQIVRVSSDEVTADIVPSDIVRFDARLYPPPGPMLPGAPDYSVRARIEGVVASGYITSSLIRVEATPGAAIGRMMRFTLRLAQFRYRAADYLASHMEMPSGGIAAALLVGDRRHVSRDTYELFRRSGLAHLLAISGLHMGLLCFGVIALLRFAGAGMAHFSSQFALHKASAVAGIIVGAGYVLLSGMPISAVRAFLMAVLVIAAILCDRLALTLRNVALAAIAILLVNPFAVFSASFQLSFAATTGLVLWYEAKSRRRNVPAGDNGTSPDGTNVRGNGGPRLAKPVRYILALIITSAIAGFATMPFAAQHFGGITLWGLVANIFGIPLTGLWIMPAGLLVAIVHLLALPDWFNDMALGIMEAGIALLVTIARFFAGMPLAGLRVVPPGYAILCLGLVGWLIAVLSINSRRQLYVGMMIIGLAFAGWALNPVADGVVLARGRVLVLAGADGIARVISTNLRPNDLSNYSKGTVSLMLAQEIGAPLTSTGWLDQPLFHTDRRGRKIAIARHPSALTAACAAGAYLVISFNQNRYPCKTPILVLADPERVSYLLSYDDDLIITD